jgi:hypothetical protein
MDLSNLQGKEDTLRAITNITNLIHQATKAAVPEKGGRQKTEAPWWNHSLTIAKQAVKRADRQTRRNPSQANYTDSQTK